MPFDSPLFLNHQSILMQFKRVRMNSERLAAPLSPEDWMLQSMAEASPVKWNLAHTSWFFETFILCPYLEGYSLFHEKYGYLFNSYYNQIGKMHPRPARGMLSRPTASDILSYREYVSAAVIRLVETASDRLIEKIAPLIALGIAHEEQHQELLLTDIKHCLFQNTLMPVAYEEPEREKNSELPGLSWETMPGGLCEIGYRGEGFYFDSEGPRHKVYLHPFELSSRPVTNADFINFIEDGGYQHPLHWLSDGWDVSQQEEWFAPLYWSKSNDGWREFTLFGERLVDPCAPVCHVSFYEASAYANWANARLPTEFEWEAAASLFPMEGRFLDDGIPAAPAPGSGEDRLHQLFGDVWEWTASPYVAYPGFTIPEGAVGEYNGKFMSGQMVLKGGSCATPAGHMRNSYRNFFPPQARWQFSGFRLARDCD